MNIAKRLSLIVIIISLLLCCCDETPYIYYPSLSDAQKRGAIKRGWIPSILPPSSTEIHEQHDIDTNETWIKFNAPLSELRILLGQLRKLTPKEIEDLFPFRHHGNWWKPTAETKDMFTIADYNYTTRYATGVTKSKTGYFFLDLKQGIGYYYYSRS